MSDLARTTLERLLALSDDALRALFHRLDDTGRAEPIGDEHDPLEAALVSEGYAVVETRPDPDGAVCIGVRGSRVVVACDAFGPWACPVGLDDLDPNAPFDLPLPMVPDPRPLTARIAELTL